MLSPNTQAILLLTSHFTKSNKEDVQPLTNREWGQFAYWLKEQGLTPEKLLYGRPEELLAFWQHSKVSTDRLLLLLNRGSALALAVEKWLRSGLWIIARSDTEYPQRLKMHLKNDSPPILFGCGNKALLNQGGIAVVGSRNAQQADLDYSRTLGSLAANQGYSIVSGGARGVDEGAMFGALKAEGTVIGVLADSLLKASSSSRYRSHLLNGNLVLVSPFQPEVGFNTGNAMQRNKYVYCLADAAIVVHSGPSGGTWNGAQENLKKAWVPLWIKPSDDPEAANSQLVNKGARPLETAPDQLDFGLLLEPDAQSVTDTEKTSSDHASNPVVEVPEPLPIEVGIKLSVNAQESTITASPENRDIPELKRDDFFDLFLAKMSEWCTSHSRSIDELQQLSGLKKPQLNDWLNRALNDGHLSKLNRPTRYQWQNDLFNDRGSEQGR